MAASTLSTTYSATVDLLATCTLTFPERDVRAPMPHRSFVSPSRVSAAPAPIPSASAEAPCTMPTSSAMAAAVEDFVTMMTQPGLGGHFTLPDVIEGLFVSLALALLTTFIGAVIAFVLGLLAACNLSSKGMSNAIKVFMSVARAVPTILWVLVFSVAIGLGPEAAVTGLLFHSVAYLVKAYSESFEEVDAGVLEALRASGASWWQVVFQGVVPEKVNEMLSWTFIRFEINFVNAVAVGAVAGAGGIGYQLFLAGSFYYNIHEVGLIVYLCLAVAVVLEVAATQLRKRYIVQH